MAPRDGVERREGRCACGTPAGPEVEARRTAGERRGRDRSPVPSLHGERRELVPWTQRTQPAATGEHEEGRAHQRRDPSHTSIMGRAARIASRPRAHQDRAVLQSRSLLPLALALLVACNRAKGAPCVRPAAKAGPRVSMAALHATGGVPPGWTFTPPPGDPIAGRTVFVEFGCPTCHTVGGEAATASGPELTGMGSHHPPEYFAEAILNPDAVIVDGPGYIGPDGRSTMPSYPDIT